MGAEEPTEAGAPTVLRGSSRKPRFGVADVCEAELLLRMAELDRQPLVVPEGDTWFVTDARLLADSQQTLFVSIYDTEIYDFGVVQRPSIHNPHLPQAKAVTAERGAAIAELLTGVEVTVGPRHRDGTLLPDAVRVRLGRVTAAVYEPAEPGAAAYHNAIDRWQLTFSVAFPAIVGDSTAPGTADYTFAEFDEVSITVPRQPGHRDRPRC